MKSCEGEPLHLCLAHSTLITFVFLVLAFTLYEDKSEVYKALYRFWGCQISNTNLTNKTDLEERR
jgi:hypothetical protein